MCQRVRPVRGRRPRSRLPHSTVAPGSRCIEGRTLRGRTKARTRAALWVGCSLLSPSHVNEVLCCFDPCAAADECVCAVVVSRHPSTSCDLGNHCVDKHAVDCDVPVGLVGLLAECDLVCCRVAHNFNYRGLRCGCQRQSEIYF